MQKIFLIKTIRTGECSRYRYVQTEEEAKLRMRELADELVVQLSQDPTVKVYITPEGPQEVHVVLQDVGAVWNGFLKAHTSITYFSVLHATNKIFDVQNDNDNDNDDDDDDDDDLFYSNSEDENKEDYMP